jgi:hypothetical protein
MDQIVDSTSGCDLLSFLDAYSGFYQIPMSSYGKDAKEGARWRQTWSRSGRRWVCGWEMIGLGFRGSGTLKKKNSSDGPDAIINGRHYI